uniref:Glycoside hydrolase family 5 domain-containing protein n=1 Tax=Alexandrium monilatum TaxID=311494 RepID=A0A7S4UK49_9DINO
MVNSSQVTPVVPLELLPLQTKGRWIVDSRSQRFRLKCVNWFGASGTQHVVYGLHKRTLQDLVSTLVTWGFNCVRLPFSLELFFTNPPVPGSKTRAEPAMAPGISGMDAYDQTVAAITGAGILVVVDNHSSDSGWCCEASALDGVWFTHEYPERRWIEALSAIARRHRSNPRVVAFDLRNEVRDTPTAQVVWGSGSVVDGKVLADWPSAAERAGNAVLAENPSLLILVTGLCYGHDLRGARDRPVQLDVPGRLVWTAHSYHWYFWWHHDIFAGKGTGAACLGLSLVCLVMAVLVLGRARRSGRRGTTPQACLEVAGAYIGFTGLVFLLYSVATRSVTSNEACSDRGRRDVEPFLQSGSVLLALGLLGIFLSIALRVWQCRRRKVAGDQESGGEASGASPSHRQGCMACVVPVLVGLALALGAVAFFTLSTVSYWLLVDHLDRAWGFVLEEGHDYTAPLLLGEFGTDKQDDFWQGLIRYITEKDLDFAYWPFNGQKWNYEKGWFIEETYGLLDSTWASVREDWKLRDVIGYTSPGR